MKQYREMMGGLDVTKQYREMMAGLDVTKQYREMMAGLDVTKQYREMMAGLDVAKAYAGVLDAVGMQGLNGLNVAQRFTETMADLDLERSFDEIIEDLAAEEDLLRDDGRGVAPAVRYAVAIYAGILFSSLWTWFYFANPEASKYVLDAATPLTWTYLFASYVFAALGGDDEDGE
jgi:hypothetical protein